MSYDISDPETDVVFPAEPTHELFRAFYDAFNQSEGGNTAQRFKDGYKAMVDHIKENQPPRVGNTVRYIGPMKNNPFYDLNAPFTVQDINILDGELDLIQNSREGIFPVKFWHVEVIKK